MIHLKTLEKNFKGLDFEISTKTLCVFLKLCDTVFHFCPLLKVAHSLSIYGGCYLVFYLSLSQTDPLISYLQSSEIASFPFPLGFLLQTTPSPMVLTLGI